MLPPSSCYTTQCHNPKELDLHLHNHENLKPHICYITYVIFWHQYDGPHVHSRAPSRYALTPNETATNPKIMPKVNTAFHNFKFQLVWPDAIKIWMQEPFTANYFTVHKVLCLYAIFVPGKHNCWQFTVAKTPRNLSHIVE